MLDRAALEDGAVLVERAAQIAARLTARGAGAEAAGRLPEETIAEVIDAGLMRAAVPRRFGGLEVEYRHIPQIQRALGRGCLATAWTIGILIQHSFQVGLYSEELQQEIWADGPDTFVPGYIVPGGTAKRVDGGYRLSGHWRFGSGFPHGQWIVLSAPEVVNGEKATLLRLALPVKDAKAINNWQVSGLAGTGTWDCSIDDVFVPAHRAMPAAGMQDGTAPGIAVNRGPLWRIALIPFYYPNMSAMMLGAAEGVAALVREQMGKRVFAYGGAHAADLGYVRANLGRHTLLLNAAAALWEAQVALVERAAYGGASGASGASGEAGAATAARGDGYASNAERFGVRANCAWVVKQARAAVNELCDQAGTSSFFMNSPLQRFHREINVLSSHAFYEFDRIATAYGQVLLDDTLPAGEMA